MPLSLKASQLVTSKICHDLAGPISAIGAGVEAMTEMPGDIGALQLVDETQRDMGARLNLFRVAFGHGGSAILADTQKLQEQLESYLRANGGRIQLNWPETFVGFDALPDNARRLFVVMVLVLIDCLPRGGAITVSIHPIDNGLGLAILGGGDRAVIRDDIAEAWSSSNGSEEHLTARNIHAHVARALAADTNTELELCLDDDANVTMAAVFQS